MLAAYPDMLPIWDDTGIMATNSRQAAIALRSVTTAKAASGLLVGGRRPKVRGEATASNKLLQTLDASIGDSITITNIATRQIYPVHIVGATVDPANRNDATVVAFVSEEPRIASMWVTNRDLSRDIQIRTAALRHQISARTVALLADERQSATIRPFLTSLRYSGPAFGLLSVCLTGILLVALTRERRRDVLACAAAGMSTRQAWRLMATAAALCLLTGSAVGTATTLGGVYFLRDAISRLLGQDWHSITVPWTDLTSFVLLLPAMAVLVAWMTARGSALSPPALAWRRVHPWAALALFTCGGSALLLMAGQVIPVSTAPFAGLATTAGATMLIATSKALIGGPALRRVVLESRRPLGILALTAAIVTFTAAYYSARQDHTAFSVEASNSLYQPRGSLFIDGISADSRAALVNQYRSLGGARTAHFLNPAESTHAIRVTSPRMVACLQERDTRNPSDVLAACGPKGTMSPVNKVALTEDLMADHEMSADTALVEGARAGLFTFQGESAMVATTAVENAQPNAVLGGILPGAVVGLNSPLARKLRLAPSGSQSLVLLDFAALPDGAKVTMRGIITRAASAAMVTEDHGHDSGGLRELSTAVAISAAAAVVTILTAAGMSFSASQRALRQLLGRIGVGRSRRRLLGLRMLLLPFGAQAIALSTARASAWLAGVHDGSGFGWVWVLPGVSGMVVCLLVAIGYGRPVNECTSF
jgi:hypothetical protein